MSKCKSRGFAPIVALVVAAAVIVGAGFGLQSWFARKAVNRSSEGKIDGEVPGKTGSVDADIVIKSPIRGIDFKTVVREKFLSNESRECLDSLDTAFFDLDGDGEEEAVVNARTCLGFSDGRNGPTISDVHRVFKLSDGGAVFDLSVDDGNFFKEVQEKISSQLEVREYDGKLEIEKGRINKTIAFQEKGATRFWSPKGGFGTIWYKWDGEKFTVDTAEAKSVTKGEIGIEFSPLQIDLVEVVRRTKLWKTVRFGEYGFEIQYPCDPQCEFRGREQFSLGGGYGSYGYGSYGESVTLPTTGYPHHPTGSPEVEVEVFLESARKKENEKYSRREDLFNLGFPYAFESIRKALTLAPDQSCQLSSFFPNEPLSNVIECKIAVVNGEKAVRVVTNKKPTVQYLITRGADRWVYITETLGSFSKLDEVYAAKEAAEISAALLPAEEIIKTAKFFGDQKQLSQKTIRSVTREEFIQYFKNHGAPRCAPAFPGDVVIIQYHERPLYADIDGDDRDEAFVQARSCRLPVLPDLVGVFKLNERGELVQIPIEESNLTPSKYDTQSYYRECEYGLSSSRDSVSKHCSYFDRARKSKRGDAARLIVFRSDGGKLIPGEIKEYEVSPPSKPKPNVPGRVEITDEEEFDFLFGDDEKLERKKIYNAWFNDFIEEYGKLVQQGTERCGDFPDDEDGDIDGDGDAEAFVAVDCVPTPQGGAISYKYAGIFKLVDGFAREIAVDKSELDREGSELKGGDYDFRSGVVVRSYSNYANWSPGKPSSITKWVYYRWNGSRLVVDVIKDEPPPLGPLKEESNEVNDDEFFDF